MSGLEPFRERLDALDAQIVDLFGQRFEICREVALYKQAHEIAMMQPNRVEQVRTNYLRRAERGGLPLEFAADVFELTIAATCKLEDDLMASLDGSRAEGHTAP